MGLTMKMSYTIIGLYVLWRLGWVGWALIVAALVVYLWMKGCG